jgi:putative beta-barrel porin BBP2
MSRCFVVAIAIVALPAVSSAQVPAGHPAEDPRSEARGHLGPFYVSPSVLLKDVGVDANVFNDAEEPKSDFTLTVAPKLDVWVPMARKAMIKTTIAPELVWFAKYASERSFNPHVGTRGELYLNRITLFGERAYLNTRQRQNYEMDVRSRYVEDTTSAGVAVSLASKVAVEVAARQKDIRYEDDQKFDRIHLGRTLNRESRGVQITGRHRLTPLTTLALRYDLAEDRFEWSPARDSNSYRVMPGVEFAPQALVKGTAYVGYRSFTPLVRQVLPQFSGIVADLGLSYTLLGSTSLGLTYRRDLTYSYSELQPFFVDSSVGASVRRALGSRFDVLVAADLHQYDYQNVQAAALDAVARVDTIWNYSGSLGYRIKGGGRIGFGVGYVQRKSPIDSHAYDNLRFVSNVSYGF